MKNIIAFWRDWRCTDFVLWLLLYALYLTVTMDVYNIGIFSLVSGDAQPACKAVTQVFLHT